MEWQLIINAMLACFAADKWWREQGERAEKRQGTRLARKKTQRKKADCRDLADELRRMVRHTKRDVLLRKFEGTEGSTQLQQRRRRIEELLRRLNDECGDVWGVRGPPGPNPDDPWSSWHDELTWLERQIATGGWVDTETINVLRAAFTRRIAAKKQPARSGAARKVAAKKKIIKKATRKKATRKKAAGKKAAGKKTARKKATRRKAKRKKTRG